VHPVGPAHFEAPGARYRYDGTNLFLRAHVSVLRRRKGYGVKRKVRKRQSIEGQRSNVAIQTVHEFPMMQEVCTGQAKQWVNKYVT
jgi:hypothetical protein